VRNRGISTKDQVRYLNEYDLLTLARVRLAEGSFDGINDLLECLLTLAETQKRTGSLIQIQLTQALVRQAQGNRSEAFAALEQALTLAEPECYLRIFVDEGEPMRSLILDFRSTIEKQGHPNIHRLFSYANKLLAAFPQSKIANQRSEIIEPLTDREREILHLIAKGCSNTEISQRLYLALSTVKGHNLRIFNKLQVQNRTEAVARARELGLI
jgi:LuxR family maltose regulon positive regulatory protein